MAIKLALIEALREQMGQARPDGGRFVTESVLDKFLPGRGFRRGALVELLGGGTTLATVIARCALRDQGAIVVVDGARRFYPPAAVRLGIDLERLIVVQPERPDWIVTQALSCSAIDAVLCWPHKVDGTMFRRWQLAAERGGGVGLIVRPISVRGTPSWADVRMVVEPQAAGRWRVQIPHGPSLEIVIDDEGRIHDREHLVSELARAMPASRAARS
jgi:protein ImuA